MLLYLLVPKQILAIKSLTYLEISNNKLAHITCDISILSNLKVLIVRSNQLERLPDELSRLTDLETLDISSNKIRIIPDWICNMQHLQVFDMSDNKISTLSLAACQALMDIREIVVHNNPWRCSSMSFINITTAVDVIKDEIRKAIQNGEITESGIDTSTPSSPIASPRLSDKLKLAIRHSREMLNASKDHLSSSKTDLSSTKTRSKSIPLTDVDTDPNNGSSNAKNAKLNNSNLEHLSDDPPAGIKSSKTSVERHSKISMNDYSPKDYDKALKQPLDMASLREQYNADSEKDGLNDESNSNTDPIPLNSLITSPDLPGLSRTTDVLVSPGAKKSGPARKGRRPPSKAFINSNFKKSTKEYAQSIEPISDHSEGNVSVSVASTTSETSDNVENIPICPKINQELPLFGTITEDSGTELKLNTIDNDKSVEQQSNIHLDETGDKTTSKGHYLPKSKLMPKIEMDALKQIQLKTIRGGRRKLITKDESEDEDTDTDPTSPVMNEQSKDNSDVNQIQSKGVENKKSGIDGLFPGRNRGMDSNNSTESTINAATINATPHTVTSTATTATINDSQASESIATTALVSKSEIIGMLNLIKVSHSILLFK